MPDPRTFVLAVHPVMDGVIDSPPGYDCFEALAVVALAKARGAFPEQVHLLTPAEWRPHLEAVHDMRTVITEQD